LVQKYHMPIVLKQRNFLLTQIFEITDKSLSVQIRKPLNYFEGEFTFEELGTKIVKIQKPFLPGIIGSGAMLLISLCFFSLYLANSREDPLYEVIICIGILTLLVTGSVIFHENVIRLFLHDTRFVKFYANSPNKREVNDFLLQLKEQQKTYLLNRYAKADPYLSSEQMLDNLKWLWEKGIISTEELENLRKANVPMMPTTDTSIGFKFGNTTD